MLFHKLADIIPNIYDVEDETIDRLSELNKKVNWNIIKYSIKKWKDDDAWKKEKDLFFEREFEKWFQEKKYKEYSAESPYFSDKKLKAKWIEKKLENIKSTEKDYKEFEKENDISKIEKDFITFRYKWTEARKNADLYEKERDSLNILKYSIKKWEKDSTWKKERDLFFKKEFEKWFQQKNYAKYLAKAPDFSEKAVIEHDKMLNSNLVIEGLLETFGDDIFNENGSYLLQKMEDKMKSKIFIPSYIDVIIQKELLKIGDEHLSKFSGTSLAMEVANIISNFFKYYKQPSIQQISDRLKSEWIDKKLKKIESTEKDHKRFEKENGSRIEKDFIDFKNKWITARKNADLYKKERDLLSEARHKRGIEQSKITIKTENGKHLTDRGIRLANEVIELELKIYVEHGQTENSGTNMTYLQNILNILMFLDKEDGVGKYANYFRAKIANNFYKVSELNSLTYLQMFPEFFVNSKLTKEEYNAGLKRLEKEILDRIIAYINLWMLNKVEKKEIVLFTKEKFQWENYITKISQSCGGFRIKGGKNTLYKGVETSENYDCNLIDENNFVCAAKVEEIPDDDLIISYDKSQDKFICFSLTDVLYALKEQDKTKKTPINYITMKEYDEDFLKRMRVRYLDLLREDFPERIITFNSTFNELLFGEKDEEIEIPTKEKKIKKSSKSIKKSVKKSTKKTALSKALESEWY